MLHLLWLIPAIPFASALVLALVGLGNLSRRMVAIAGSRLGRSLSSDLVWRLCSAILWPLGTPFTQLLWTWIDVAGFRPEIAFYLDPLSLLMVVVVTFVSFLIQSRTPPNLWRKTRVTAGSSRT